jgi:hypothetical protein
MSISSVCLRAIAASVAVLSLAIVSVRLHAHGFEGDRFFPPTISTDDPFATDEYSIGASTFNNPVSPDGSTPKTREIDVSTEFDKEIFPKFALGVSGTYIDLDPQHDAAPYVNGFDNVELSAKYQLFENPEHEFIFSIGTIVDLGDTGSKSVADDFSTITPTVYFGKGFGDLPDGMKYAKPFALTGTVGYAIPSTASNADGSLNPNDLQWGLALEYSIPYLQQHVEDVGIPHPFADMIPVVEFNMNSPTNRYGGTTTGTIDPGVMWETKYAQFGAEAQIPVNRTTGPNVGAVIQVQIFIDDLFPKIFGHPIFFSDENNNPSDHEAANPDSGK